jgi:hypothetical protein
MKGTFLSIAEGWIVRLDDDLGAMGVRLWNQLDKLIKTDGYIKTSHTN